MTEQSTASEVREEFHSKPVPMASRLGFGEPALVWSGFGVAFICAVIGGLIQQGLGTGNAILAILTGNLILFVYSALIGYANGKWGLNFPLTVKEVFGRKGATIPILILALLVTGWYAFQAWLTSDVLRVAFDIQTAGAVGVIAAVAAVIYAIPVIFGIHQMANVRKVAIPAMVLFVLYYMIARVIPNFGEVMSREGNGNISFLVGVGMAWSTFVVSGTMTGDIVRYTRNGHQAVWVTAVAFLFSNAPFMIMGALISAAVNDANVVYFFDQKTAAVLIPLAFLAILSCWSTCDACLYNASMGFSNSLPGFNWRRAAILGTIIGLIAAGTGLISDVVKWLILLGLLVPPIGGTIIADYFFVRGEGGFGVSRTSEYNWAAIIAIVIGVGLGYWQNVVWPEFLFGAIGIVSSFAIYLILVKVAGAQLGAQLSDTSSGAEAEAVRPTPAAAMPD